MSKDDGHQDEAVVRNDDVKGSPSVKEQDRWQSGPVPIHRGGGRSSGYRHHGGGSYGSGPKRGGYHQRGGARRHSGGMGESPPFRGGRGGGHQSPSMGSHSPSGGHVSQQASRFSSGSTSGHHYGGTQSNGGYAKPMATPPPPPPTKVVPSPSVATDGWQYKDPEDDVHGPYPASKIVNWVDKGYFSEGLPVRKVTKEGMGAWTTLKFVLIDMRRESALTITPSEPPEEKSSPAVVTRPPPPPVKAKSPDKDIVHSPSLKEEERRPIGKWERDPRGSRSRFGGGDRWSSDTDKNQMRSQKSGKVDRSNGRGDFRGRGRGSDRGGGRGRGRGGGRGRGRASSTDPDLADAVCNLFTGEVDQGAEQPMWRYIDYEGATQGPFPAKTMIDWFEGGYLADSAIPVCGTERKVSPPNLPPPEFYLPLGALIYWVRRGHHFKPITVADIQSKNLPEELATLKESAEKAFEGVNKEKETAAAKAASSAKEKTMSPVPKPDERPTTVGRSDLSWAEADEMEIIGFGDNDTADLSSVEKSLQQVSIDVETSDADK